MAVTITTQSTGLGNRVLKDNAATSTAVKNVTGSASTLYTVFVTNPNGFKVWLKIYDNVAPTIGTTVPDFIFQVDASVSRQYIMTAGSTFANGISYAVIKGNGGTGGTTAPDSVCTVWMVTS